MRTARRSKLKVTAVALAALAVVNVLAMVAFTRSTTPTPAESSLAGKTIIPPEDESAENLPGSLTPDEFSDLKKSSGDEVTEDMVRRQQAQAAAIAPAATNIASAWKQLGPYNIGGRVTDVVADRFNANSAFAAVAGGGIWKTTNGGQDWTSIWPDENVQAMGAFAQAPDGTLWAGTGEANPPGGGLTYFGDGVYKSTDNGATWTKMGLEGSAAIGRIAVDPKDSNTVFVAAAGHIARSAAQRGLYRTQDGGKTWEQVIVPTTPMTGGNDVDINPANPDVIYASMWDHKRTNGTRTYGGIGSGLFRSEDGGDTWERLENIVDPLPAWDETKTGLKADPSLGRIGIAIAPSDPNRIYVVSGSPYGPDKGFYWSDDGGDTLRVGGRAYASNGFQWWFGKIWVDPEDKNLIFNADVNLRRSTDGGQTWGNVGGVHADQHAMDWDRSTIDGDPATPRRVFLGNDGGTYRSENNGAPGSWIKSNNQPWNQAYHIDVSPFDSQRMIIGLQDNGSNKSWTPAVPSPSDPVLKDWNSAGGGDGHYVVIDPLDDRVYYACSQSSGAGRHSCQGRRDTATGTTNFTVTNNGFPAGQRYTTDAPLVIDPNVPPAGQDGVVPPNAIYVGGNYIGRSLDRGTSFSTISPIDTTPADPTDPTDALPGAIPQDEIDIGLYTNLYGAVTALAPAKSPTPVPYAQVIYAGTDTGLVWKTEDAGATWKRMQGLPTRWVNSIIADPDNPNHAYIAFSGFRQGDDAANVYETTDGGTTWVNVSHNMPNGPVEMLEYDPKGDVLFAATDVGVFDRKDGDSYWYKVSVGLPNVPMMDLKLSGDGKELIVATFGRSQFKLPLSTDATDGGGAGGSVPATLGLTLGQAASFGAFQAGVARTYSASTTASVTSSAGDATLSVTDPSMNAPGRLVNGTFSLAAPVQAKATSPAGAGTAFGPVSANPLTLLSYTNPVSNDQVAVSFEQQIGANDPLRTGSYSKTLTFTLSTTNP